VKENELMPAVKVCNMSPYSHEAQWHVYNARVMLDKRI
jgi:hypothetical protein